MSMLLRTESSRLSFLFFPFHIPNTSNTLFFFLNAWKPYPSIVSCTPQIDKNLITFDQLYLVVAFLSCVGSSVSKFSNQFETQRCCLVQLGLPFFVVINSFSARNNNSGALLNYFFKQIHFRLA